MKILLVEDNCIVQRVVMRMLNRLGYLCHVVSTGEAACAAMKGASFQIILMDMDLPGIGGLETARTIRAMQSPQTPLWIIALTGWSSSHTLPHVESDIGDHLVKPLSLEALQKALELAESYLATGTAATSGTTPGLGNEAWVM